jgi:hypothetical protein
MIDGKSRSKESIDLVEKTGNKAHLITAPPAIGDLNGDGTPEIIVQSNVPQYVSVIDISRYDVKWTYFVDPTPPVGLKHTASPVLTDLNNDGLDDVVVLSANGCVYGLRGETGYPAGELLWKLELPEAGKLIGTPALCDFDKDSSKEIVFGGENGNIYVLKNMPDRKEVEAIASIRASNVPITASPAIGDIDGNGKLEIIFSNVINTVQILNTNVKTWKNKIVWGEYLGSPEHNGFVNEDSIASYVKMAIASTAIFLCYIIIRILIKVKRMKKRPRISYL